MRAAGSVVAAIAAIAIVACTPLGGGRRTNPPPTPARRPTLDLSIYSFALPNGLRVVLVRDPNAAEVTVTMRYQVGSVDDPADHPGMAHLVEHLMYEPVLDGESLFARLERSTTYFNGATTFDATTYVSRAQPDRFEDLLAIEAARVESRCATINPSGFAREREVVINEIRQRDAASETLAAIHQALYPVNHPYRRPIGGSVDSLAAITQKQACAFADAHYAPNNAALVVAGNFTAAQEQAVFYKYVGTSPKRDVAPAVPIYQVAFQPWYVSAQVPFDDDALLVAWPLPADARQRAKVRALAATTAALVESEIDGSAPIVELGDSRAPMIAMVVLPAPGELLQHAREGMERGVARLPGMIEQTDPHALGDFAFTRLQQAGIYRLYETLEDRDRDNRMAGIVLSGGDPRAVFADELVGLQTFSPYEASYLAREMFALPRAKVVVLQASHGVKTGNRIALGASVHDFGQQRRVPDAAAAHHAAPANLAARGIAGMTWRRLTNGMEVVLIPSTSIPTVQIRLVVRTGSADEPADKRGLATLAAEALSWNMQYAHELVAFASVGGTKIVDVGPDHTTFAAHGVDMNIDLLLTGLSRWVREGIYDDSVDTTIGAMDRARRKFDEDDAFTDAWRTALFGIGHPYAHAGFARYINPRLGIDDAAQFRAEHYTPDNATLVIAGRFDPALAGKWIDYLFSDWKGRARPRADRRGTSTIVSLAKAAEGPQVHARIAIPATTGTRAQQLVAAELLAAIVGDVRHQLGASYDLTAVLSEQRLATNYAIAGWIDATRTEAAMLLVRDRLRALRENPEAAARAFVTARERVATHLGSSSGSAEAFAERAERDIALSRPPLDDARVARDVQALTIEQMAGVLAELDLAGATIALHGSPVEIQRAFAVLGRVPTYVK